MTRYSARACLSVLLMLVLVAPARAVLTIRITQGTEGAQPIAIVPFGWNGPGAAPPVDVAGVIADDLALTGRFAPTPRKDLPGTPSSAAQVNFSDWRMLGTSNLVIGDVALLPDGEYRVRFRLFDVYAAKQLAGYQTEVPAARLRLTAHQFADIIYKALTGQRGAFATRIAYVTVKGPAKARRWALVVADSDGYNAHAILRSREPIISPAWSPDGRRIAYVSFEHGHSEVYVQDVATGKREVIANYPGINGAPAWAPDGHTLALTLSKDGNAEIYLYDLDTRRLTRLTFDPAIDTEPTFSPNGKTIAFTSDRGGSPQIYTMPADGGPATRVTFDGNYNAEAQYDPADPNKIALVHQSPSKGFVIALLDLRNGAMRDLSDGPLDRSPSFAPNGSMILYATTGAAGEQLAEVSADGRVHKVLTEAGGQARGPAWGPFETR